MSSLSDNQGWMRTAPQASTGRGGGEIKGQGERENTTQLFRQNWDGMVSFCDWEWPGSHPLLVIPSVQGKEVFNIKMGTVSLP